MLEATGLTAAYDDYTALQGVTCRVEGGRTIALMGPTARARAPSCDWPPASWSPPVARSA